MTPVTEVRQTVSEFVKGDKWVVDGNYSMSRDIVLKNVDHVIVLRLPLPLVLWRLFWREFGRLYGFSLLSFSPQPKRITQAQEEGFWRSVQILGEQTIRWNTGKYRKILTELQDAGVSHQLITTQSQLSAFLSSVST